MIAGLLINTYFPSNKFIDISISYFKYLIINISRNILESFQNVLKKYLLDVKFYVPFMLSAGEGIFRLLMISILLLIVNNITCIDNKYKLCVGEQKPVDNFVEAMNYLFTHKGELITYILILITLFFYNPVRILTNQHFTPLHRNIAKDLRLFMLFFLEFIPYFGNNIEHIWMAFGETATYIIMFIGDLIFLEGIILNFWNLNKNTKKEVIKRETEENIDKLLLERLSNISELYSDESK